MDADPIVEAVGETAKEMAVSGAGMAIKARGAIDTITEFGKSIARLFS